ncbi:dipeptide/oligopeptide/nickel ABC transporter permease/ATP-binding protein [Occultella glacieicola]|uniref:Dipeptide/oligopeptide/nickel ABC transporter permease/ATP-binding protein n=1 Tax=Occultella glacieicola TaxID=2518684 RepID=A0ABY2DYZ6_9MICO|nr:dipeptide/oligopeptide/nickel ABC transporter permease/ATP-binding protein [Occultella glacieicola]TDE89194.1 dipeptide/oligopeptide/nickel ABC transporter permease/ATP-binding protein [Occultella glacieicola]
MRLSRFLPTSGKVRAGLIIAVFFVLLAVFGPLLTSYSPQASGTDLLQPPSGTHWLGTTQTGQDVFAQFVYGARISLGVGLVAGILSQIVSVLVGVIGGYFRGLSDDLLYILTAVFLVVPGMPLLIVLTGYLPSRGMVSVAFVIAITSWAGSARVLRAQTMSLRRREFVEAARATGESRTRIVFSEIMPNALPLIASGFLFSVIGAVLAEAGLSFLGLGSLTTTSWGSMLYFAQSAQAFLYGAWWWFVPPGLAIAVLGAGLALINFGIDEYSNPRLRTGRSRARAVRSRGPHAAALSTAGASAAASGAETPGVATILHDDAPDETVGSVPAGAAPAPPQIRELDVPGKPIIEVRHLKVDYPGADQVVHAVDDVSITLHRGELLGLAGESGSGKSTLTNAITRLLRNPAQVTGGSITYHRSARGRPSGPTTGGSEAEVEAIDLLGLSTEELRAYRWDELAIVFQSAMNALNAVTSVGAQFDDVLRVHRPTMPAREREALARTMLEKVGIDPGRVSAYPHELSGGMKQRVAIAIALVLEPDVIVMDEPTTALDLLIQREVLDQVMALRDEYGFAIIFTTHDLSLLLEVSDSIAVMQRGRLVEYGPALEVYAEPRHPYTRALLASLADMGALV